eukprot:IDg14928t1
MDVLRKRVIIFLYAEARRKSSVYGGMLVQSTVVALSMRAATKFSRREAYWLLRHAPSRLREEMMYCTSIYRLLESSLPNAVQQVNITVAHRKWHAASALPTAAERGGTWPRA